jgi:hypothetical protein
MATDIKLKDYILYKYKERIKVAIEYAAVPQCLYASRPWSEQLLPLHRPSFNGRNAPIVGR